MPPTNTATNRTFFSNFLAAFRAHSAIKAASSHSTPSTQTSYAQATASAATSQGASATQARPLTTTTKPGSHQVSAAVSVQGPSHFTSKRQHSTSPLSRSPGPTSPTSSNTPTNNFPIGSPPLSRSRRRGSDSSSDSGGFRDALGGEKWYIGGRTAQGEERFFQLGMVRRPRSVDRLSTDRLSL
ncbi:MAG: hypothetical protein M1820_004104 [Bogoriella megaspora]|nr:MAG: hypothetical protein M1820_004104 [Bogoriella megaspora]